MNAIILSILFCNLIFPINKVPHLALQYFYNLNFTFHIIAIKAKNTFPLLVEVPRDQWLWKNVYPQNYTTSGSHACYSYLLLWMKEWTARAGPHLNSFRKHKLTGFPLSFLLDDKQKGTEFSRPWTVRCILSQEKILKNQNPTSSDVCGKEGCHVTPWFKYVNVVHTCLVNICFCLE